MSDYHSQRENAAPQAPNRPCIRAVRLNSAAERTIPFDGYMRRFLERNLQELTSISTLPDFRRLMRAAAPGVGQMLPAVPWWRVL